MRASRARAREYNSWPGFVDVLSSLLLVFIFLLVVFVLSQFLLNQALSGRDAEVARLNQQIAELSQLLQLEKDEGAEIQSSMDALSASLASTAAAKDAMALQLADLTARAQAAEAALAELKGKAGDAHSRLATETARANTAMAELDQTRQALVEERKISAEAKAQVDLLNQQIAALREQLRRLEAALDLEIAKTKDQNVQIADLGKKLNIALANKVEELSRYRSEFFGRLREALGDRPDIRVVGDRFVFQSEVLFASGSDEIAPEGKTQLATLAKTLKSIAPRIPRELPWILRIDGHTDRVPIQTERFPSNWELSTARAIAVVKFLDQQGIPSERLAAAGFGEFHPLDGRDDEISRRRNRRIEIKLTDR